MSDVEKLKNYYCEHFCGLPADPAFCGRNCSEAVGFADEMKALFKQSGYRPVPEEDDEGLLELRTIRAIVARILKSNWIPEDFRVLAKAQKALTESKYEPFNPEVLGDEEIRKVIAEHCGYDWTDINLVGIEKKVSQATIDQVKVPLYRRKE